MLDAAPDDVEFADGVYSSRATNATVTIKEVAKASYQLMHPAALGVGLEGVGYFDAKPQNYPNGCHLVEVEVDPETGEVSVDRYHAVDDVGVVANPIILDGQVHGSVAQGIGQALMENVVYDEDGQILSGSFVDYAMPRAIDVPRISSATRNIPTNSNPLGVKGGAEVGTVGAPPAIVQAVLDAVRPLGVEELDMPVTPMRLWTAINTAKCAAARNHH